jgi:adenylate cyclase
LDFDTLAGSRRGIEQLGRLLRVLAQLSNLPVKLDTPEQIARHALEVLLEAMSAEHGFVALRGEGTGALQILASMSGRHAQGGLQQAAPSRTILAQALEQGVGVLAGDAAGDPRFARNESVYKQVLRSVIAAPVGSQGQVLGVAYLEARERSWAFGVEDLDLLMAAGQHLALAIQRAVLNARVTEQALLRQRLERYVPAGVVATLERTAGGDALAFHAEERDVSVLFADVVGFTQLAEEVAATALVERLNASFSVMTDAVFAEGGTVDKFIGDALMAVFGAPLSSVDHASCAARAACRMLRTLDCQCASLTLRIGVHSGPVISADVGSERRRDFTVLGPTVNVAARLQAQVADPGQVVISSATQQRLGAGFRTQSIGLRTLRGVRAPVECHLVLDAAIAS